MNTTMELMHHYADRLNAAIRTKKTPALVGLDPRADWLPEEVLAAARSRASSAEDVTATAFEEFCCRIIDVVAARIPAVKPQAAFFEQYGPAGCRALAAVIRKARNAGLVVICDAKRGDIGTTAEAYAQAYLAGADPNASLWGSDALTVNPYLGADTLEPFVKVAKERGAGIYVLVRTSNPGAGTFQDAVDVAGRKLYQRVAATVEALSQQTLGTDGQGLVGAVVGATYPSELAELRAAMPSTPLLIPGYGAQGGGAAEVAAGFQRTGLGAIVNSSRGINFAWRQEPYKSRFSPAQWEQAVDAATDAMIADLAQHTPAGTLH